MAERFMSINPDNMELGKFYSVFTDKDNATLLIKKDVQDAVNADVATMKTTQNGLVLDMTNAKDDINNLETNVTNLNTNMANLGTDVTNLETDNNTNKANILTLQTDNTTNKSDISSLKSDNTTNKSNISSLQTDNETNKTDISNLKTDNTANKSDISSLKSDNTTNKSNISNLQTDNTTNKTNISNLQADNTTNKSEIATLKTDNTTNKSDISTLKSNVTTLQTDNSTNKTNISTLQSDNTTNKSDISTLKSDNTTNKTNISDLQTDNTTNKSNISSLQTAAEGINPSPVGQCWVSPNGLDTNNGGINKPFKTIQKALDSLYELINLLPGTYTEDLNIPIGYGQYAPCISGAGTFESPKSFIRGTITIPAGVSRLRIKDLHLDGKNIAPAIIDNSSDGRHVLENVTVADAATNGDVIRVINGKNWWNIEGSTIEGIINLSGTGNTATFNIMNSPNSFLCTPIINSGYTFTAFYVGKMGIINHVGGNVFCTYVGAWYPVGGKIINSTSTNPLDVIGVGYSAFTADLITYGTISSIGATVLRNYNADSAYQDVCLSAVSTVASTLITTTASTLIAGTKKVEKNINYNATNGELIFTKTGSYNITAVIKIDCTEWNKKVETWIEKWNGTSWDAVADTGVQRMFQTDQEVEINYHFASYFTAGEKYRLRAVSDSDTTIAAKTITLTNNVKMPAIRISVYA